MESKKPKTLTDYVAAREKLLAEILTYLTNDGRFVAAWLTGSFGRGEEDAVSDLDLNVVVADSHAEKLCARPWQVGAGTTEERLALVSRFGRPAIIHENHHNAPEGGSFTFVLYAETALMVDWIMVPQAQVKRPQESLLLFDKVGIAKQLPAAPESLEQRIERASEQVAFFWMMAAVTVKYLIRQDYVSFHKSLDWLHGLVDSVKRLTAGEAPRYRGGSLVGMATTLEEQVEAVRQVCERMLELMPEVKGLGGRVPASPMSAIEILLRLVGREEHAAREAEWSEVERQGVGLKWLAGEDQNECRKNTRTPYEANLNPGC